MQRSAVGIVLLSLVIGIQAARGADDSKVLFDPYENKFVEDQAELIYDAASSKGALLRLGPRTFEDSSLTVAVTLLSELEPRPIMKEDETVLFLRAPTAYIPHGSKVDLRAVDADGNVLWSETFKSKAWEKWVTETKQIWKTTPNSEAKPTTGIWASELGLRDAKGVIKDLQKAGKEFRFCLSDRGAELGTVICTSEQRLTVDGQKARLEATGEHTEALAKIDDKDVALGGKVHVEPNQVIRFFARLTSGATIDFIGKPTGPEMSDLVRTSELTAKAGGDGVGPIGAVFGKIEEPDGVLARAWQPTIGVPPRHWSINIDSAEPFVYYRGEGGGIFRRKIVFAALPTEAIRPVIVSSAPVSTYASSALLKVRKPKGVELSSTEVSVEQAQSDEPVWRFKTSETAGPGRAHLKVATEQNKDGFIAHYEIDRRLQYEVSARLSGMTFESRGFVLTEGAFGIWYENFLGSDAPWALRRWGTNVRYSNAALGVSSSRDGATTVKDVRFSVLTAELRYRFTPGTWGHDESWGLLGSFQDLRIGEAQIRMGGAGFWWGRSMPKVFDDLFNYLPLMKYPKWVDLDFTYYPLDFSPKTELGTTWILNFHGKIFWTERFFGEAGFGSKQYNFVDNANRVRSDFNALFVTGGLGLNF